MQNLFSGVHMTTKMKLLVACPVMENTYFPVLLASFCWQLLYKTMGTLHLPFVPLNRIHKYSGSINLRVEVNLTLSMGLLWRYIFKSQVIRKQHISCGFKTLQEHVSQYGFSNICITSGYTASITVHARRTHTEG